MSTRVRLRSSMIEMPAPKSTAMSTTRVSEAVTCGPPRAVGGGQGRHELGVGVLRPLGDLGALALLEVGPAAAPPRSRSPPSSPSSPESSSCRSTSAAEPAEDVEHEADDHEVHADVEERRRADRDVCRAPARRPRTTPTGGRSPPKSSDAVAVPAASSRPVPSSRPASTGRRLAELVAPAREVAGDEGEAGEESAGEAAAGRVVSDEEQEDRDDDRRVEEQAHEHLDEDRAVARGQGAPGEQPRLARGGGLGRGIRFALGVGEARAGRADARRVLGHRLQAVAPVHGVDVGEVAEPRCAAGAARHEDQARDAGGDGDEHRDLAEGVPGADVDEHHVDDVLAVRLDRERGQSVGDGRLDAGAERDEADDAP